MALLNLRLMQVGLVALASALAVAPTPAFAAKFANQFAEFELPPQWQCNLEGAEWVCQSVDQAKKRDAIIVLAAKLKSDQDSLDQYLDYLKAPKTYVSVQGKQVKSEVRFAKTVALNGHSWVDSLHLDSEIPGFYTRYVATVKQDIGVLITYSINKNKYQEYIQDFDNLVKTLRVFRKSGGINAAPAAGNLFANTTIPTTVSEGTVFPGAGPEGGSENSGAKKPKNDDLPLLPILLVGGAVGFIIWRRRQGGG